MVNAIEVSVVIPCLNEEKTIGLCVKKAQESFRRSGINCEVVVVDNGSTDRSVQIAEGAGARVICEEQKGYGSALRRGINESLGEFIVMADGDDTYDFMLAGSFVERLKEGYDLVMGSRFRGKILPGAMTWSHRYIGNPILSGMLRLFFGAGVSDAHCGLRAFTKTAYHKMGLHTTGMEFASEMVIHAMKKRLKITEIPITYFPRLGESKLDSFKDAWRHIRFMLMYSPNYLFMLPGILLFSVGFSLSAKLVFGNLVIAGHTWGTHVMVFSGMLTILGWQILILGFCAKVFAHIVGLEQSPYVEKMLKLLSLERILVFGIILLLCGIAMYIYILGVWAVNGFGVLSQVQTGIGAMMLASMGVQAMFAAFLTGMLQIKFKI